jgi:dCTP deaminase
MIWSDVDIERELTSGIRARIKPFDKANIQPASIDLRLGNVFWGYDVTWGAYARKPIIDVRKPTKDLMYRFEREETLLYPQCFLLGSTKERISLGNDVIARIEGKSSLGRIGLTIHSTAGFIDPGNTDLSLTVELFNQGPYPILLRAGMFICQVAFQDTKTPCAIPYGPARKSRYFGDHEPVPSIPKE